MMVLLWHRDPAACALMRQAPQRSACIVGHHACLCDCFFFAPPTGPLVFLGTRQQGFVSGESDVTVMCKNEPRLNIFAALNASFLYFVIVLSFLYGLFGSVARRLAPASRFVVNRRFFFYRQIVSWRLSFEPILTTRRFSEQLSCAAAKDYN